MSLLLSRDEIEKEERDAVERLRGLEQSGGRKRELKLTGLEILAFIGAKIVVPIITGFISRAIYEKYKDAHTASKLEEARREILASQPGQDPVDEQTIKEDISAILVREGIPQAQAEKVVAETLESIKAKMQPSKA
ncbi:MAG TPA: hypothetical protein VJS44_01355 [Pyrinomonadaceae bacterium]|nr:hypothetical protein [Pyrinomonadaceae bacterium]